MNIKSIKSRKTNIQFQITVKTRFAFKNKIKIKLTVEYKKAFVGVSRE